MNVPAPFPAFGGKSAVADLVWQRLGYIRNYVAPSYDGRTEFDMVYEEPFANSAAIMLRNPAYDWENGRWRVKLPPIETINDLDPFITNFWRSVKFAADEVAEYADWPVNEADLHARHVWLVQQGRTWFRDRMMTDPDFFDPKIAGWWVWGIGAWIGPAWCDLSDKPARGGQQRPHLSSNGQGVHRKQLPHLNGRGSGIHAGTRRDGLKAWFAVLQHRLRDVRTTCGDWSRVTGKTTTWNNNCTRGKNAITAAVIDSPYDPKLRVANLYAEDDTVDGDPLSTAVRDWCLSEGDNPKMRIVLFGYEEEHGPHMPSSWECVAWKANGGYGNQGEGENENAKQERIWFSPHCLRPDLKRKKIKEEIPLLAGIWEDA